jgi:PBP1b-binding outer membrane lipoprotein LpoB
MKTHILTALMALILSACASHHRDVASVQDETGTTQSATGRADFPVLDGAGNRGGHF